MHTPLRPAMVARLARLASALAVAVVLSAAPALAIAPALEAHADDAAPGVRWSVLPADASGPDGRRSVEVRLDPGQSAADHFAVRNVGDAEVTFRLTAADGFTTPTGRFDILADGAASVDAGRWISVADSVTVPAGATVIVPFTIAVPATAQPGDHSAGITASVLSVKRSDGAARVGVESRVGFRIAARVAGTIEPAASLHAAAGSYHIGWNPLRPGSAVVDFDVVNDGNTRVQAIGTVALGGRTVAFPAPGEAVADLLPGDRRTVRVVVDDVWPSVYVPATISLTPRALTIGGDTPAVAATSASTALWAPPVSQLLVVVGMVLLVLAVFWGRLRSRRRIDSLVADAREQGRRAAVEERTSEGARG